MEKPANPSSSTGKGFSSSRSLREDVDQIIEIIQFSGKNQITELEIDTPNLKISLKKGMAGSMVVPGEPVTSLAVSPTPSRSVQTLQPSPSPEPLKLPAEEKKPVGEAFHQVLSPIAGTFYRAPSPNSPPYVTEGAEVTVGQPICIVEAMKLMNEIKADKAGKIEKILVENGKAVDKGTVLFQISFKG